VGREHPNLEGTRRALGWAPEVALREEVERMVRVASQRLATGVEHDTAYLGSV
jgi:hypothetical protein